MDDFTRLTTLMEASGVKRSVREVPKMQSEEQLRKEYAPTIMGSLQEGRRQAAEGIQTLAAGIGKGVSLGLTDHIAAKVLQYTRAAQGGLRDPQNTYENALRDVRKENKRMETQRPVAYGTGQVAGGAMLTPAFVGATTIPQIAARTAIMGGVQGGAGAETLADIPQEAAIGAGIGATTGTIAGGVGKVTDILSKTQTRNVLASNLENMLNTWEKGGKAQYLSYIGKSPTEKLSRKNEKELLEDVTKQINYFRSGRLEAPPILIKGQPTATRAEKLDILAKENYLAPKFTVPAERFLSQERARTIQELPGEVAKSGLYGLGFGGLGAVGGSMLGLDPYSSGLLAALGGGAVGAKQALLSGAGQLSSINAARAVLKGQPTAITPLAETAARAGTMMTVPTANEFYNPRVDEQEVSRIEELLRRPKFVAED